MPYFAHSEAPTARVDKQIPVKDAVSVSIIGKRMREFSKESTVAAKSKESTGSQISRRQANTRLIEAVREGSYKKTVAAIGEGADVHTRTLRKETPLMLAAASNSKTTKETLQFLLDTMSDLESKDDMGWTALMHACRNNRREVITMLLESGASIKARALDGKTVAMLATMEGGAGLVVDLVSQQAAVDKKDEAGWNVLFYACEAGRTDLVKWLLKRTDGKKPEINLKDKSKDGVSLMMVAAQIGHKKIGEMLLHQKASLNSKCTILGLTPLMLAVKSSRAEFADWLIHKHAEISAENMAGENAIDIALSLGLNALANRLELKQKLDDGTAQQELDNTVLL